MAEVQCAGCNGSGQIHRGYDGRRIRCPECMGRGRVSEEYANRPGGPGDIGSRSSASPKRQPRDIPAEISERAGIPSDAGAPSPTSPELPSWDVPEEMFERPGGPPDAGNPSPTFHKRPSWSVPAEIFERRRAAERGTGLSMPLGVRLHLLRSRVVLRSRRLRFTLYRWMPGAGRRRRVSTRGWFRVALVWFGLLAAVLAVGEITGFLESRTWPWGFQVPDWWPR